MKLTDVTHISGLDLGQGNQPTAFAIIEQRMYEMPDPDEPEYSEYHLRHLERFPAGTSYPEIFQQVRATRINAQVESGPLVVDQSGVGPAVIKLLRRVYPGSHLHQVTITTGLQAEKDGHGGWLVPKKELVGVLQVLLQTRALKISASMPLTDVLVEEMHTFSAKIVPSTQENLVDWRQGRHDDLVLAVGIACWEAERGGNMHQWLRTINKINRQDPTVELAERLYPSRRTLSEW